MRHVLVTGGAGYVGSHVVRDLNEQGYRVTVYDNLSEGHREAVPGTRCVFADITDAERLEETLREHPVDAVLHFAAFAYVGESVIDPEKYYRNNVGATLQLLASMRKYGVKNILFSSSCATYGNPVYLPIDERHPQAPVNPYGASKRMVERILEDYRQAYGVRYVILRYFNAAGAHPDGSLGESHRIETHLIPLILKTLTGEQESVSIYGTDYATPDGTCVRDYIHVCDLARAHRLALERLAADSESICLNLGTGRGYSVKEVVGVCERVTGLKARVAYAPRRPGDPPLLTAANGRAKELLGFEPEYGLSDCVKTAWNWECSRKY